MILDAGTSPNSDGTMHYHFFDDEIYGVDHTLQQIVEYFRSAASRLEVRKRILLLMGPVGGGKSSIVSLMKRGLEQYSRTDDGAVYAIKGCPMHEEPMHLVPDTLRAEIEREYGVYIEGDLCPRCRYELAHTYGGRAEDVEIERIAFSEKSASASAPSRHPTRSRKTSPNSSAALTSVRLRKSASRVIRAPTASMAN
jgi:serine protein kinase